ncbi:MAG: beta-lactamase family protein [Deltaproteobacteria bacterium]|nr:beta-lactamase family protein [Deltaproteobacteria bacterium]
MSRRNPSSIVVRLVAVAVTVAVASAAFVACVACSVCRPARELASASSASSASSPLPSASFSLLPSGSREQAEARRTRLGASFQREVERVCAALKLPGMTAAYALPNGVVGGAAAGYADLERHTSMTMRSRMLAASVGKSFVAATALALAQEGALDLDAPIATVLSDRAWLSRLPNYDTITTRHLLMHASGLPDHVHRPEFARDVALHWRDLDRAFSPETLVEYVFDGPALFPAGQGWSYSDTGYILVGLIIEKTTGRPYEEALVRRFLEPLGLDATTPSNRRVLPGLATGYTAAENPLGLPAKTTTAPGVMAWDPAIEWTGGGLVSTPRDLVVWARALYEGRALPTSDVDDLMRSVAVGSEDSGVRYGAGVAIHQRTVLGPSYGHGGTIPGYVSSMRYYPRYGFAVAFQINTDVDVTDSVTDIERRLAEIVAHGE